MGLMNNTFNIKHFECLKEADFNRFLIDFNYLVPVLFDYLNCLRIKKYIKIKINLYFTMTILFLFSLFYKRKPAFTDGFAHSAQTSELL